MTDLPNTDEPLDLSVRISTDEWNSLVNRLGTTVPVTDSWVTDADSPSINPGAHSIENVIDTTEAPFIDLGDTDMDTVHTFLARMTRPWDDRQTDTYTIRITIDLTRWNEDAVGAALQEMSATAILEHLTHRRLIRRPD